MHTLRGATCQPKMTFRNLVKKKTLTWTLHEGSGTRGKQNGEFLYSTSRARCREFSPMRLVSGVVATPQSSLETSTGLCSVRSAKPSLSPVMVNRSWAQPVVIGDARGTIQDDAGGLHPEHLAILFVHDLIYASCNAIGPPAILEHFRIEQKAAVAILLV